MLVNLENYLEDNASEHYFEKWNIKVGGDHIYPSSPAQIDPKVYQLVSEETLLFMEASS